MDEEKTDKSMIGIKDKLGYAFGDMGIQLTFILWGPFLMMFFTDVLSLPLEQISLMMLVTRIWSAFADPIGGSLFDKIKPGKTGRYRRWLLVFAGPFAVSAAMMFVNPGLAGNGNLVWVYLTNLVYGTFFTGVNIPFGSLASVISPLESDRSSLSTFRSLGSGIGSMPGIVLLPRLIYSVLPGTQVEYLDEKKLLVGVAVLAVFSAAALAGSFAFTKERVTPPAGSRPQTGKTILALLKNRPFLALCAVSVLHMAVVNYTQSISAYLFKDYFNDAGAFMWYAIFNYAPMGILLFLIGRLVSRFGKKEVCSAGLVLCVAAYTLAFLLKLSSPWAYLLLVFVNGLGLTCLTLQLWAIVTDVIDYQKLLSGQHDEGSTFGFFFFARKVGFAIADSGVPQALKRAGYDGSRDVQLPGVPAKLYRMTTMLPAGALLAMFLLLAFAYPLGKKQLGEMHERMAERDRAKAKEVTA